jgi:hypothetical protein
LVERELGDMTPEKLRLPNNMHQQYREKALLYREAWALAGMATAAKDPQLRQVMKELQSVVQAKRISRGVRDASPDQVMYAAFDSVEDLFADPFKWAQRWLMEFRHDANDNFMAVLFADHWSRQFNAVKHAIESTRRK